MLNNVYDPLVEIADVIKTIVRPEFVWMNLEIDLIDTDIFDVDVAIPPNENVGVIVQYTGFKTDTNHKNTVISNIINLEYRIIVIAPDELFHSVVGVKWIEILKALNGLSIGEQCFKLTLIDDIREFNEPDFVSGFCATPMVLSLKVIV